MKKEWFYNLNLKPQGPFSVDEIREHILKGQIGPNDLLFKEGIGEWRPAFAWGVFEQTLFPAIQGVVPGLEVIQDEKEWVLLVPGESGATHLQEGPYSIHELREALKNCRISPQQYIWKSGLSGWARIQDRPEFSSERP